MKTTAYEARVENGVIRLLESAALPEHARVIVVVPESAADITLPPLPLDRIAYVRSPRLVNPDDARKLAKHIVEMPA